MIITVSYFLSAAVGGGGFGWKSDSMSVSSRELTGILMSLEVTLATGAVAA